MIGLIHWIGFKILVAYSKFSKPMQPDWRGVKIQSTIAPNENLTFVEYQKNLYEKIRTNK